jgi:hypothetical protein
LRIADWSFNAGIGNEIANQQSTMKSSIDNPDRHSPIVNP